MYVSAPERYWLGQKVKGQGHSKRRYNRRRQPVEFHLVLLMIQWSTRSMPYRNNYLVSQLLFKK